MNRTGILIALALAVLVGLLFGLYPQLDMKIAALAYDPASRKFIFGGEWSSWLRDQSMFVVTLFAAPPILALIVKLIAPRWRMPISIRAAIYLTVTLLLAPGFLVNGVFKDDWHRSRPMDVKEFAGKEYFTAWWDSRGGCTMNCSFVSGEASAAYWLIAPASLAPPQWRAAAYAGAIAFGTAVGAFRMAFGGHFASDVLFAGLFTFMLIWVVHGLIFRWPRPSISDEAVERAFERVTIPLHLAVGRAIMRIGTAIRRAARTRPTGERS